LFGFSMYIISMSSLQAKSQNFKWVSPEIAKDKAYIIMHADIDKLVSSWRSSIVAHEWVVKGQFRTPEEMKPHILEEWQEVYDQFKSSDTLERPILGLGVLDNVEIGTNRAILSVAHHLGADVIDVLVPESLEESIGSIVR
jgi:ferritin-like metal-binding protein YciE